VATYSLTGDLSNCVGTDLTNGKTVPKAWLVPYAQAVGEAGEIRIGSVPLTLNSAQVFAQTDIPEGGYLVRCRYWDPAQGQMTTWDSPWFNLVEDTDLYDVVPAPAGSLGPQVTYANVQAVLALGTTNDSVIAAKVGDAASLTHAAIVTLVPFSEDFANFNIRGGVESLASVTTGQYNSAFGNGALKFTTTGNQNSAMGFHALEFNQDGTNNSALGYQALVRNITGDHNTAVGIQALAYSDSDENTAIGSQACYSLTTGIRNTVVGRYALYAATTADSNIAIGFQASHVLTTSNNTVLGHQAAYQANNDTANATTTGFNQTVVGFQAGQYSATQVQDVTAIGFRAVVGGNHATALGANAQARANGSVAIGRDQGGTAAIATVADDFVLGTVQHRVKISNNSTGAGSAALGANCPATTLTAPYTWLKMASSDGSTVYVPAWK
jgi:hypothetical protein